MCNSPAYRNLLRRTVFVTLQREGVLWMTECSNCLCGVQLISFVIHNYITVTEKCGLITRTLGPSNDFTLLNGWICLHDVRLSRLLVGFRTHYKSMHFHFISTKISLPRCQIYVRAWI